MTKTAMASQSHVTALYDDLAGSYDARYSGDRERLENAFYASWISTPSLESDEVLDLGCGTGLLVDLLGHRVLPERYAGIDPSEKMLAQFRAKHPDHVVFQRTAEEFFDRHDRTWDVIVAGFGVGSYLQPETIARLPERLKDDGVGLIMTYRDGYLPEYHDVPPPHLDVSREIAASLGKTTLWHDFEVTVFHRRGDRA